MCLLTFLGLALSCRREHSAGRAWYQLRGNKLYQHMGPGPTTAADLVHTVLGLGELEDGVEIESGIRAFVVNLAVHGGASEERPAQGKGAAKDAGSGAAPASPEGVSASECKIFYALSIDEAQHWLAALQDATDEDRVVPGDQAALVEWMAHVAEQLREGQSRGAEGARHMLCSNAVGLARTVADSTPTGANALHVAARFFGHDGALLEALSQACAGSLLQTDDTGALPLHVLLTYFPHETEAVVSMYSAMAALNKGAAPAAADHKGSTPLHTIARYFRAGGEDGQLGGGGQLARSCIGTISALIQLRYYYHYYIASASTTTTPTITTCTTITPPPPSPPTTTTTTATTTTSTITITFNISV